MENYIYNPSNFVEYSIFFMFIIMCTLMAMLFLILSEILGDQKTDLEKLSAYECGFDPFGDARHTFSMKFYLVAILFMIFDLEIAFLLPWAVTVNSYQTFYAMIVFLMMLTVGFIYEWRRGALDW